MVYSTRDWVTTDTGHSAGYNASGWTSVEHLLAACGDVLHKHTLLWSHPSFHSGLAYFVGVYFDRSRYPFDLFSVACTSIAYLDRMSYGVGQRLQRHPTSILHSGNILGNISRSA